MMWNMSAPLPTSLLGILISTVDPGSLLGPLFIAYNIRQRRKNRTKEKKIEKNGPHAEHSIGCDICASSSTWKVRLRGWKLHFMSSSWTNREASMEFPYVKELGVTTLQRDQRGT